MEPNPSSSLIEHRPALPRSLVLYGDREISSSTAKLLLAGLLLPNLLSLATFLSIIDIGLPPRTASIILYGTLAISARRIPYALTAALFLGLLAFDLVWTISLMFGLAPSELVVALEHAARIRLFSSPLYACLIAAVCATTVASLLLLRCREDMVQGNIYLLLVGMLVLTGIDLAQATSAQFSFNTMFGRNRPVVSAADVSGFRAAAGVDGRNVVVVIVESLGYLVDPEARERIAAPLKTPNLADKYVVTSGHADYYGATTSGEMRELCETRTPYAEFARQSGADCLPAKLRGLGYSTLAVHGFESGMFERKDWYPQIGFGKAVFGDDLLTRLPRRCGNAFRSVCDADLPPLIAKEAGNIKGPRFIYWLTLNTHIPVPPGDAIANYDCAAAQPQFSPPAVCRMIELWNDLFAAVAKLALDPAIGPAEILIVGDHAPPVWSKRGRSQFAPGQVAWYRLTPR